MFKVDSINSPVQHDGYWTRDAMLFNDGPVAVTVYHQSRPEEALFEQPDILERAGVLCAGFLEPRNHAGLVALAGALAAHADTTVLTFDARGVHDSNIAGNRYTIDQVTADMAGLATMLAPKDRLVLGGQSMGGVFALRTAVRLYEDHALRGTDVVPTDVFTVKTPHVPRAHKPFAGFSLHGARRGKFYAYDAGGKRTSTPVFLGGEVFDEHEASGDVRPLIRTISDQPRAANILLTASLEDSEMPEEIATLHDIADQHTEVDFAEVAGTHSDRSAAASARTAAVILDWYTARDRQLCAS